jgi:hypothetical protein
LFAVLPSLVAPVVPVTVDEPGVVGVPVTEQTMLPPGATDVGGTGAQVNESPAGSPVTAHEAAVAATAGAAAFLQVNEPVYGTPTVTAVGNPVRLMLMSEPDTATALVAVLLPPPDVPPLVSFVAPVEAVTVDEPSAVGVPETAQEMLAPAATVAGGVGVHVPTVTPGGRPETEQLAFVALAVADALFVHLTVPL